MPVLSANAFLQDFDFGDEFTALHMYHLIGKHNPVILEIGANCGQSTVTFIEQMPNATIYCFEPDPRAIAKFKQLIQHPTVYLIEAAVGADSGFVMFNQSSGAEHIDPSGWDHSGSIRKPKTHLQAFPGVKFEKQIPVPLIKLDNWIQEHRIGTIDFIWADVQGAESDLILGSIDTLRKTRYFYTEYSDDEQYEGQINLQTLTILLSEIGFEVLYKYRNDVIFQNSKVAF